MIGFLFGIGAMGLLTVVLLPMVYAFGKAQGLTIGALRNVSATLTPCRDGTLSIILQSPEAMPSVCTVSINAKDAWRIFVTYRRLRLVRCATEQIGCSPGTHPPEDAAS